jgi:YVTN family beta-propeller protein
VKVGYYPIGIAVNPMGTKVLVANYGSGEGIGTVSVIDTTSNNVTATIGVGSHPSKIAVNPDGTKAYVTNAESNTVSVISIG